MIELLISKKFKLPTIYFITDRKDIKDLAIGIPFIYGNDRDKKSIIRMLEYEILYQAALRTKMPFNFKKILEENGYKGLSKHSFYFPVYVDYSSEEYFDLDEDVDLSEYFELISDDGEEFNDCMKDISAYVDISVLKSLNVFPVWEDVIEKAVEANIQNFAMYNPFLYNKKLEGTYGTMEFTSPKRNLIIVDISGSIPKSVATTTLVMSKNMGESFHADIMITGGITVLYEYERIHEIHTEDIYATIGRNNDQKYFKALVTESEKHYGTVIAFGDNDHPGTGRNGENYISDEDGKSICKWKVDKIISFHTESTKYIAGYARWFDVTDENIERIDNWVKYLED